MITAFVICSSLYLLLLIAKAGATCFQAGKEEQEEASGLEPGELTVAQAILSGDDGLEKMLESNLESLRGQHFLWLCDEDDAEALRVTDVLMSRHSKEAITRLSCPPCPAGINPKVFKIIHGSSHVDTPFLLVLDDDTHLPEQSAFMLVRHARSHDIATGLPQYRNGSGLPSTLLAQFVNNNSALTYLSLLPLIEPISINGMCYVMRAEKIGVFQEIAEHLTDDLALAIRIRRQGGSIHQSSARQILATQVQGMGHYRRMMHRWYVFAMLLLKEQPPGIQLIIILLHGSHPLLLWCLMVMVAAAPSMFTVGVLAGVLVLRAGLLVLIQRRVFRQVMHLPWSSLASELLQPFHLIHALMDRDIEWRGRRYRVHASDRFEAHD